ncbi:hypothetical protein QYF36_013144 [Acer negundo]|nr:hypothetical protein QYF36_013144 [Acer negundo]
MVSGLTLRRGGGFPGCEMVFFFRVDDDLKFSIFLIDLDFFIVFFFISGPLLILLTSCRGEGPKEKVKELAARSKNPAAWVVESDETSSDFEFR